MTTTNYSLAPRVAQVQSGFQMPQNNGVPNLNASLAGYGQMAPVDYSLGSMASPTMPGMNGQGLTIPAWGQSGGLPTGTNPAGGGGMFGIQGLGANMPTFQLGMQGLGALSSFMMGNKSLDLANKQFEFTKATTNTNMNNQLQAYNGSLEDKLRTRGQFNGDDPSKAIDEYERRKLTRSA